MTRKTPRGGPSKSDRPKRAKRNRRKNSVENSGAVPEQPAAPSEPEGAPGRDPEVPPDVPMRPGENGGELRSGNPGNKGGGRPRNEVREMALRGFEENLPRLIRIAAGTETRTALVTVGEMQVAVEVQPTFKESVDAMRELGNRGVGKMLEIELPKTPVSFGFLVSPEVAAERAAGEPPDEG